MSRTRVIIGAVVVAAAALLAGAQIATAGGEGEDEGPDTPITGAALDEAKAAALAETGQGRVTGTEVGDEESYYEVEVTLDNGTQVDVQLDESFHVVSSSRDEEHESGDDD